MSLSVIRAYRKNYVWTVNPVTGRRTRSNGDEVARALAHVPNDHLEAFCRGYFRADYSHLNRGHARLCNGNRVRAAYKRNDADVKSFLNRYAPGATL